MRRIVLDIKTGIASEVPLTAAEIAAIEATPPETPPPPAPSLADRVATLEAQVAALLAR